MDVFRIIDARHRDRLLDGSVAARTGGRWNRRGSPAVYASLTISLAILEVVDPHDREAMSTWYLGIIDVPVSPLPRLDRQQLPRCWRQFPLQTQAIGSQWFQQGAAGLIVPSVVHDHEENLVLNPAHPDFCRVTVRSCEPLLSRQYQPAMSLR